MLQLIKMNKNIPPLNIINLHLRRCCKQYLASSAIHNPAFQSGCSMVLCTVYVIVPPNK